MVGDLRVQRPDGSLPWPWEQQPPATPEGTKLFQDFSDSVVYIQNGYTSGTGWVGPDGRVVTAYHVIKGATELFAITKDGRRYRLGGRVSIDDVGDLAALEFVDAAPNLRRLPVGIEAKPGSDVRTIGHPGGAPLHLSEGKFTRTSTLLQNATELGKPVPVKSFSNALDAEDFRRFLNSPMMISEIPIRKGNSGGPVFNARNEVVSVCSMGGDGYLLAPSPERMSAFLNCKPGEEPFQNAGYHTNGFSAFLTRLERQPLSTALDSAFAAFAAYGVQRFQPKSGIAIRSCATALVLPYLGGQTYFDMKGYLGSTSSMDSWKYGLATVADSAMILGLAGAAITRNPKIMLASKAICAGGALGRLATEAIPNRYVLDVSRTNGDTRAPFLDHLIWFPLSAQKLNGVQLSADLTLQGEPVPAVDRPIVDVARAATIEESVNANSVASIGVTTKRFHGASNHLEAGRFKLAAVVPQYFPK